MKPAPLPSQTKIREWLHYEPTTGIFVWIKKSSPRAMVGDKAGTICGQYRVIALERKAYKAHRLAWVYVYGKEPAELLDHINGDTSDNRICNLREASYSGNSRNSKKRQGNISGYKGVVPSGLKSKPWKAQINVGGKVRSLGFFVDPYEAHLVWCAAAKEAYGEFARFA